jgi:multicomponent Na+:H+ antiporter subunit D
MMIAPVILVVIAVFYGAGSEYVYPYILQAAETLANPEIYIEAVLKEY